MYHSIINQAIGKIGHIEHSVTAGLTAECKPRRRNSTAAGMLFGNNITPATTTVSLQLWSPFGLARRIKVLNETLTVQDHPANCQGDCSPVVGRRDRIKLNHQHRDPCPFHDRSQRLLWSLGLGKTYCSTSAGGKVADQTSQRHEK